MFQIQTNAYAMLSPNKDMDIYILDDGVVFVYLKTDKIHTFRPGGNRETSLRLVKEAFGE